MSVLIIVIVVIYISLPFVAFWAIVKIGEQNSDLNKSIKKANKNLDK